MTKFEDMQKSVFELRNNVDNTQEVLASRIDHNEKYFDGQKSEQYNYGVLTDHHEIG